MARSHECHPRAEEEAGLLADATEFGSDTGCESGSGWREPGASGKYDHGLRDPCRRTARSLS